MLTRTTVAEVRGRGRVAEVVLERDGRRSVVPCDTVVFTGDWIPDHELARTRGAELTRRTRARAVDATGATTVPG